MAANPAHKAWGDFVERTFLLLLSHRIIQCLLPLNVTKTFKELALDSTIPLEVRYYLPEKVYEYAATYS